MEHWLSLITLCVPVVFKYMSRSLFLKMFPVTMLSEAKAGDELVTQESAASVQGSSTMAIPAPKPLAFCPVIVLWWTDV